ncbi:hypothetical protein HDU78_008493, partial [Chytriomyces hyalinus]
ALAEKIEKPDNEEELKQLAVILRGLLGVSSDAEAEYTVVPAKEREDVDDKKRGDSADAEDVEHDEL